MKKKNNTATTTDTNKVEKTVKKNKSKPLPTMEFVETYQTVSEEFTQCIPHIEVVKNAIDSDKFIDKATKKILLGKVDLMAKQMSDIVGNIGKIGKVK